MVMGCHLTPTALTTPRPSFRVPTRPRGGGRGCWRKSRVTGDPSALVYGKENMIIVIGLGERGRESGEKINLYKVTIKQIINTIALDSDILGDFCLLQ